MYLSELIEFPSSCPANEPSSSPRQMLYLSHSSQDHACLLQPLSAMGAPRLRGQLPHVCPQPPQIPLTSAPAPPAMNNSPWVLWLLPQLWTLEPQGSSIAEIKAGRICPSPGLTLPSLYCIGWQVLCWWSEFSMQLSVWYENSVFILDPYFILFYF